MASFLEQAGRAAFKRGFEEVTEPVIDRSIRDGMDTNQTAKAVLSAANGIPGVRLVGHSLFKATGELLEKYAGSLWQGDNRPQVVALREALKLVGPGLIATTDATADVIERIGKEQVDRVVSSETAAPADRKAALDQGVFLWLVEFPGRILIPAKNDDGSIRFDSQNIPIILDPEVMARRHAEKYTRSTTRQVGQGKDRKTVTDPPQRPDFIGPFALRDAVQMVDMGKWDPAAAEAVQKLLAPKTSYFASWGDDVWDVIRAYNATFATRKAQTGYDWLDQEESEGLVKTMLKAQPDVALIRELVGKRFKSRIGQNGANPGELSLLDCDEIEQIVLDQWLGGEQPLYTKIVRRVRRFKRSGAIRGVSQVSVMWAVAGVSGAIWMPVVGMGLVLLVAVLMFVQGVFTPLTGGAVPFLGVAYDAKAFAMASVFLAGWLAFTVTWFFPIYQTATAWVRTLFPSLKEDWLTSLGRRIVAFGLLFCSGIEFYAVALNVAPIWRVVILAAAGVGIAVAMGLAEAGYRYVAEEMVASAAKPTIVVFAIIPLLMVFTVGVAQGNPAQTSTVWSWLSALTVSHRAILHFVALVMCLLVLAVFLFGGSKGERGGFGTKSEQSGGDRAITLASILIGGGAFLTVLFILGGMALAGLHEIGSWFDDDTASATTIVVTQSKDNGSSFDKDALCKDPLVPEHQRRLLNCP